MCEFGFWEVTSVWKAHHGQGRSAAEIDEKHIADHT